MKVLAAAIIGLAAALSATPALALSLTEALLRAKPAVVLVTARVDAEITMNCGKGPVTVKPKPFVETGTVVTPAPNTPLICPGVNLSDPRTC